MKDFFKRLHTLFNALLASQVAFCLAAVPLIQKSAQPMVMVVSYNSENASTPPISQTGILSLVFLLSAAAVAYLMDSQRKAQGAILQGLWEKAEHYRQSSIIRLMMVEIANVIAIVVAMREHNLIYLLYLVLGMLLFLHFRPTAEKFVHQYQLSPLEAEQVKTKF